MPPPLGIRARIAVADVVDGDTVDVEIVIPLRVRLLRCSSPESRTTNTAEKKLGLKAKQELAAIATGQRGTLFVPTDRAESLMDVLTLDRVLGQVWLDGNQKSLAEIQVGAATRPPSKAGGSANETALATDRHQQLSRHGERPGRLRQRRPRLA